MFTVCLPGVSDQNKRKKTFRFGLKRICYYVLNANDGDSVQNHSTISNCKHFKRATDFQVQNPIRLFD